MSEGYESERAQELFATHVFLKCRDALAERAGVRRDQAADFVAHADPMRTVDYGDDFDVILNKERQADRFAELLARLAHQGARGSITWLTS